MADASLTFQRQLRDKAASSLDNLRDKLTVSPAKTPNWNKIEPKSPNAYSASVDRLKGLLKKYETLKANDKKSLEEDILNRTFVPQPDELAPLFNDQHTLMQHLEGQVSYYKDALQMLKQKADMVIEENSRLHEQLRTQIEDQIDDLEDNKQQKSLSFEKTDEDISTREIGVQADRLPSTTEVAANTSPDGSSNSALGNQQLVETSIDEHAMLQVHDKTATNLSYGDIDEEILKMKDVYSSKAKHMEGLLQSARNELDEKQEQINTLQQKLRKKNGIILNEAESEALLCVKCAHNEAVLGNMRFSSNEKVLRRIKNENDELSETINKQRQIIEDMKRRELEAYIQVKKSCEMAEQNQLEKHEVVVNLKQMNQELERLKEQNKSQLVKSNEQIKKEKLKLQLNHEQDMKGLNKKLEDTGESLSRTEIQLDRAVREKMDLKDTLAKIKEENALRDSEIDEKLVEARRAVAEVNREKSLLEQERVRLENENRALSSIKEKQLGWSNSELIQVKKRMMMTEKQLEGSQENCMKLAECLRNAEKQLQTERNLKIQQETFYQDRLAQISKNNKSNEEKLQSLLQESEGKYEATRQELTTLLESQMQIANRFKVECKQLSEKLESAEKTRREQLAEVCNENQSLKSQLEGLLKQNKILEDSTLASNENIKGLEKAIQSSEVQLKGQAEKAITLLNKYNTVLRERHLLCEEIEFLKTQLPGFRHSDRISISDLDSSEKGAL